MNGSITQDTLDAIKGSFAGDDVQKALTTGEGVRGIDLEDGFKVLLPSIEKLCPLRASIPRVSGKGGEGASWRAVTAIAGSGIGLGEGQTGGQTTFTKVDKTAAYRSLGLDGSVTDEAEKQAGSFENAQAFETAKVLRQFAIGHERVILGGNTGLALGTTGTPTLAASAGGALAASTQSVICVALTLEAFRNSSVAAGVQISYTRTNGDGSTTPVKGGHGAKSTAATLAVTAGQQILASVAHTSGAVGYAWFWGTAGNEVLGAITALNAVMIKAAAAGTQNATAITADSSSDPLLYDGLITQLFTGGGMLRRLAVGADGLGTALSSDGLGGVLELQDLNQDMFDANKIGFNTFWCSSRTAKAISKVMAVNGSTQVVVHQVAPGTNNMAGGISFNQHLNQATQLQTDIKVHVDMPDGMVLAVTSETPYALDVQNLMQIKYLEGINQETFARQSRKTRFNIRTQEVLQHYFPASMGLITGIKV